MMKPYRELRFSHDDINVHADDDDDDVLTIQGNKYIIGT